MAKWFALTGQYNKRLNSIGYITRMILAGQSGGVYMVNVLNEAV